MKSIIKILGGKSRLLPSLSKYFPTDLKEEEYTYIEPFVGGASVLLYLVENNLVKSSNCYINDYNQDITNLYECVKESPEYLLTLVDGYAKNIDKLSFENVKHIFNTQYLHWYLSSNKEDHYQRAAMFIYLNHTDFNGLIRYNKSGLFNAPYGKYANPSIYKKEDIQKFHNLMIDCNLNDRGGEDFEIYLKRMISILINKKVFVYLDPPYIPISKTSSFAEYTPQGFAIFDHIRLRNTVDLLNNNGHKFLLSNSNCILTKEFFKGYDIKTLYNNRSIAATSKSRGFIKEVIIKNY